MRPKDLVVICSPVELVVQRTGELGWTRERNLTGVQTSLFRDAASGVGVVVAGYGSMVEAPSVVT